MTSVADHVEFHIHAMDGSVMIMRRLESIDQKAGEAAELNPGGLHIMIMLIDLKRPLKEGESIPLTLMLDSGASIATEVEVLGPISMGPAPWNS